MKYYITTNATSPIETSSNTIRFTPADRVGGILRGVHATDDVRQQLEIADVAEQYGVREISVDRYNQLISKRALIQASVSYDPARTQAPLAGSVAVKVKELPIAEEADTPPAVVDAEQHEQDLEDLSATEEVKEPKPDPDEEGEEIPEYVRTHADLVPFLPEGLTEEDIKLYARRKNSPKKNVRGHSIQDWKIFLEGQVDEQEAVESEEAKLSDTGL